MTKWIKTKYNSFIILNIIIPILFGAIIYYLFFPDIIFVKLIDDILGVSFHIVSAPQNVIILKNVRYYLMDMLWAYSLTYALYLIIANERNKLFLVAVTTFAFSAFMELLQLTSCVSGTFDVLDILVELIAIVFAIFIINNQYEKGISNNEKN